MLNSKPMLMGTIAVVLALAAAGPAEAKGFKLKLPKIKIPGIVVAAIVPVAAIAAVAAGKPIEKTVTAQIEPPKLTPAILLGVPLIPHVKVTGSGVVGDAINEADKLNRKVEDFAAKTGGKAAEAVKDSVEKAGEVVEDGAKKVGKAVEKAVTWPVRKVESWFDKMKAKAKTAIDDTIEKGRAVAQGFVNQAFAALGLVLTGLLFLLMIAREFPRRRLA